jgi:hypothetical protein
MKKVAYQLTTLSSLIVSPRSDRAFYRDLDDSIEEFCSKQSDDDNNNNKQKLDKSKLKIIYPFYRYGEYESYSPEQAEYYLPGSSIKGALTNPNGEGPNTSHKFMFDDIKIDGGSVVLCNLYKLQYINEPITKGKLEPFFENVGVEMVTAGAVLQGEFYAEDMTAAKELLGKANCITRKKIKQLIAYLEDVKETEAKKIDHGCAEDISEIRKKLNPLQDNGDVILLGGYKGLLHSICLNNNAGEINSAVFIDKETYLPHGLLQIDLNTTA